MIRAVEQRVADFIRWMEDRSDARDYMWMMNLLQLWVATTSTESETILTVYGQPFGVGRLSNGICRYRYDSILSDRKTCPGGGADLITTAFAAGFDHHHHHHHVYGIKSRWALLLVDPTTGMAPIGVLEFVTLDEYPPEYHGMLTQCFLDFGPKFYEQFCKDMRGESGQYLDQQYYSNHHLPTQDMTFEKDWSWREMYDMSNGLLTNASEDHTYSANGFGMQQNTGLAMNYEISESSGNDNFFDAIDFDLFSSDHYSANGVWSSNDPVPAQENSGGTNHQTDEISDFDPAIWDYGEEDEQVGVPIVLENIDESSNLVDEPIIIEDEQAPAQESTSSSTRKHRNPRQPSYDGLKPYFGIPLREVAAIFRVHRSTIKRWCRDCAIEKWPLSKKRYKATQKRGTGHPNTMIVKARYGEITVKVRNFDSTKEFEWLTKELGVKLKLQVGSFRIEYKDDTGNLITISCTEHLMGRLDSLYSSNTNRMYLIVSGSN